MIEREGERDDVSDRDEPKGPDLLFKEKTQEDMKYASGEQADTLYLISFSSQRHVNYITQ